MTNDDTRWAANTKSLSVATVMARRKLDPRAPVLFLDYDGVLHPDAVYRQRGVGIVLRAQGELFENAPMLEALLAPHPDVQIVLSTTWVRVVGFDRSVARLSSALAGRVVGATWHRHMNQYEWCVLSRWEQIARYVQRHRLQRWLSIDNDDSEWPDEARSHLVHTDDHRGLSEARVQTLFARALTNL